MPFVRCIHFDDGLELLHKIGGTGNIEISSYTFNRVPQKFVVVNVISYMLVSNNIATDHSEKQEIKQSFKCF